MMTIHAIIKEGKVIPTEPLSFADGTKVTVEITPMQNQTVGELLDRLAGKARDLPSDLAENHDHYRRERRVS